MHLTGDIALNLIEGRADASQKAFWEGHLTQCSNCGRELEEWRQMHQTLGRTHLENAPADVIQRAEAIFQTAAPVAASGLRQIAAALVFDSFAQPAFAGARGVAEARQVVLRAEEFDIHVKVWGERAQRQLVGQLLARGQSSFVQSARLHLLRNGERFESTLIDRLGEFHFNDVPDGLLSLQIDLPHLTVVGALNVSEMP